MITSYKFNQSEELI